MKNAYRAAAFTALLFLPVVANAQTAVGVGQASSSARSQAAGVGNNFGSQSFRANNALTNMNTFTSMNTNSNLAQGGRGGNARALNLVSVNNPPSNAGTNSGTGNTFNSGNTSVHNPQFAPSVYAPSVGGSACTDYISIGGSGPGGGLSFAFPLANHDCNMRQNTQVLAGLGLKQVGIQNMCFSTEVAQAMASMGKACLVGPSAGKVTSFGSRRVARR